MDMSHRLKSLPQDTSCQKNLASFVSSSSATSSSKEGYEGLFSQLTSNVNDNGVKPENDEESSELETESGDGDLTTLDSLCLPEWKHRKSSGAGKHRKSGFDPKGTHEFKMQD